MTRQWDAGVEGCGEGPCAISLVCYVMADRRKGINCLKQVGRKLGLNAERSIVFVARVCARVYRQRRPVRQYGERHCSEKFDRSDGRGSRHGWWSGREV